MSNPITIIGTVATHPRLITTQSGVVICSFRLASGERRFDRAQQKWIDGETNWFGVTAFRALAEHASTSFRKGERVIVTGRLRVRKWENEEKSGTAVEIDAEALGHDLRWGISRFEKRVGTTDAGESSSEGTWPGSPGSPVAGTAESEGAPHDSGDDDLEHAHAAGSEAPDAERNAVEERGDGFLPVAA